MSMYGGKSQDSSECDVSELYNSADNISSSVQSFFADYKERK